MTKELAIRLACYHFNYKFPKELFTGILFFEGYKIIIEEFQDCCKLFRG